MPAGKAGNERLPHEILDNESNCPCNMQGSLRSTLRISDNFKSIICSISKFLCVDAVPYSSRSAGIGGFVHAKCVRMFDSLCDHRSVCFVSSSRFRSMSRIVEIFLLLNVKLRFITKRSTCRSCVLMEMISYSSLLQIHNLLPPFADTDTGFPIGYMISCLQPQC